MEAEQGPSGLGTGQLGRARHLVDLPNGTSMYGGPLPTQILKERNKKYTVEKKKFC
jgi:hypothetical protein